MEAKSTVIPTALLLFVLFSAFSFTPAEAMIEKVRKEPFSEEVIPGIAKIEGWVIYTYGEEQTPQGVKWHASGVAQFDAIDMLTGKVVGRGQDTFAQNGLLVGDNNEDVIMEENAVVNLLGPDMQGIEYRIKIIFVMQNGDIKVNVYLVPPLP